MTTPEPRSNARVWVLDDPQVAASRRVLGIAERLGVPFRRIPLAWNWIAPVAALAPHGSLIGLVPPRPDDAARLEDWSTLAEAERPAEARPALVLSAGARAGAVALWMKAHFGCAIAHATAPGPGSPLRSRADLLVVPRHDAPRATASSDQALGNVFPVLGVPHLISPLVLRRAATAWYDRLSYLPQPRIALLFGGPSDRAWRGAEVPPAQAHDLGRRIAQLAVNRGGSVMAIAHRSVGSEATDALAAGLGPSMHLIHRGGEPGPNPYRGTLALADTVVVTSDSLVRMSQACAVRAPVFFALPELAGSRQRHLAAALIDAGHARPLVDHLMPWRRTPLDEAGRVAAAIQLRIPLD